MTSSRRSSPFCGRNCASPTPIAPRSRDRAAARAARAARPARSATAQLGERRGRCARAPMLEQRPRGDVRERRARRRRHDQSAAAGTAPAPRRARARSSSRRAARCRPSPVTRLATRDCMVGARGRLRKIRRLRSSAANRSRWAIIISDLPSISTPRVAQREVEVAQDVRLRLRIEVHQRVAADEQVQPRDRRVLDEVVAAEDQRSPQVGAERVALVRRARSSARAAPAARARPRARVYVAWRAASSALLVDVGRVDLHALACTSSSPSASQRIIAIVYGLLAGGAAGAPHADRLVGAACRQDQRQRLVCEVAPRPAGRGRSR